MDSLVPMLAAAALAVAGLVAIRTRQRDGSGEPALLFGDDPADGFPGPAARRWALGVLFEAGVDADADPRYAARLLLRAEPRLGEDRARAIVDALA